MFATSVLLAVACGKDDVAQTASTDCTPTTCSAAGAACGSVDDGCGGTLSCGTCTVSGETCGGGGVPNVCGAVACTATTCAAAGKNCGTIDDGCGGTLACGTCTVAGETCGGGGIANVCAAGTCTPTTCAAEGKECGTISDGCSDTLECGTCAGSGEACVDNACTSACDSGNFSFFVISLEAIQAAGGSEGLGGNLGGLAGADALCQSAADAVGACDKRWVAFLSVVDGGDGNPIDAIDRIGQGPWYDVNGLLVAAGIDGLLHDRPDGDDATVVWTDAWGQDWVFADCLTTELGNCNHTYGDSHDTLTGSNAQGRLYSTDSKYTCGDWTSTTNASSCSSGNPIGCWPAIGHTWPAHSGQNWIFSHLAGGCEANINLADRFENGVGGHGGYGAFYCFGLTE
jgi:hypothetical protein